MDHEQIDRYQLLETLQIRGPRALYLARDTETRQLVALESFQRELFSSRGRSEKWLEHARALRALRHPNLIPVLDADYNGCFYVAREWVAGQTLGSLLSAGWELQPAQAAHVGAGIADALACLHHHNRLHGAVCPHNVVLGLEGQVLLEGLGGLLFPEADEADYVAPEVRDGVRPGAAADVYGLGAILRRLYVPPACSEESPLPDPLTALIHTMIAEDPAARPACCGAVAETLRAFYRREAPEPEPEPSEDEVLDIADIPAEWNLPLITVAATREEDDGAVVRERQPGFLARLGSRVRLRRSTAMVLLGLLGCGLAAGSTSADPANGASGSSNEVWRSASEQPVRTPNAHRPTPDAAERPRPDA